MARSSCLPPSQSGARFIHTRPKTRILAGDQHSWNPSKFRDSNTPPVKRQQSDLKIVSDSETAIWYIGRLLQIGAPHETKEQLQVDFENVYHYVYSQKSWDGHVGIDEVEEAVRRYRKRSKRRVGSPQYTPKEPTRPIIFQYSALKFRERFDQSNPLGYHHINLELVHLLWKSTRMILQNKDKRPWNNPDTTFVADLKGTYIRVGLAFILSYLIRKFGELRSPDAVKSLVRERRGLLLDTRAGWAYDYGINEAGERLFSRVLRLQPTLDWTTKRVFDDKFEFALDDAPRPLRKSEERRHAHCAHQAEVVSRAIRTGRRSKGFSTATRQESNAQIIPEAENPQVPSLTLDRCEDIDRTGKRNLSKWRKLAGRSKSWSLCPRVVAVARNNHRIRNGRESHDARFHRSPLWIPSLFVRGQDKHPAQTAKKMIRLRDRMRGVGKLENYFWTIKDQLSDLIEDNAEKDAEIGFRFSVRTEIGNDLQPPTPFIRLTFQHRALVGGEGSLEHFLPTGLSLRSRFEVIRFERNDKHTDVYSVRDTWDARRVDAINEVLEAHVSLGEYYGKSEMYAKRRKRAMRESDNGETIVDEFWLYLTKTGTFLSAKNRITWNQIGAARSSVPVLAVGRRVVVLRIQPRTQMFKLRRTDKEFPKLPSSQHQDLTARKPRCILRGTKTYAAVLPRAVQRETKDVPSIPRVHQRPQMGRVEVFELIDSIGYDLKIQLANITDMKRDLTDMERDHNELGKLLATVDSHLQRAQEHYHRWSARVVKTFNEE
ncbi:hypothetical protein EK21DRAFT_115847 [Setomelanomma holmii]|uniref:Uncharacterized protein n=1 Tax=Setomelanomma holmii TaxID=210430 RepID=A0A9P4H2F7_9PLEO|nr:hypothetical protein EK21DRAFT_115847 [Setomelanomma holmii]